MEPAEPEELVDIEDVNLQCAWSVSLDGWNGASPTSTELPALTSEGVTLCLSLDSTQNLERAHLAAATEIGMGAASLIEMALFDDEDKIMEEGWDVTVGQSAPKTFANLEYTLPVGQVTIAKLFVRSLRSSPVSNRLQISFFEPFE